MSTDHPRGRPHRSLSSGRHYHDRMTATPPPHRLFAGVVTFNPDVTRLRENLDAVAPQVADVIVVDNASDVEPDAGPYTVHRFPENRGIAVALNEIMRLATAGGATAVLLLDQDSVAEQGMVGGLEQSLLPGVALVAPNIVDRGLGGEEGGSKRDVNFCITSGSLLRVDAWAAVGGYDEAMFIDFVDFDFCLRLRSSGYRIVRDDGVALVHEIGNARRVAGVVAYNHSAARSYHMGRDMVYYARKHRKSPKALKVGGRGVALTLAVLARKAVIIVLHETDKLARVSALLRGAISGMLTRSI